MLTSNLVPTGGAAKATTSIVSYFSTAGIVGAPILAQQLSGTKTSLSGALTANTLKTMLNISGSAGCMPQLALTRVDATARTVRLKVTVDGITIFDITDANTSTANVGIAAAGEYSGTNNIADGEPIRWRTTCLVEIASSITETDKIQLLYKYHLES